MGERKKEKENRKERRKPLREYVRVLSLNPLG